MPSTWIFAPPRAAFGTSTTMLPLVFWPALNSVKLSVESKPTPEVRLVVGAVRRDELERVRVAGVTATPCRARSRDGEERAVLRLLAVLRVLRVLLRVGNVHVHDVFAERCDVVLVDLGRLGGLRVWVGERSSGCARAEPTCSAPPFCARRAPRGPRAPNTAGKNIACLALLAYFVDIASSGNGTSDVLSSWPRRCTSASLSITQG
jgi:hypothetical protein